MALAILTRIFILAAVASAAYLVAGNAGCGGFFLLMLLAARLAGRRWPGSGTTHGQAAFATTEEVRAVGMDRPGSGLHLGRLVAHRPTRRSAVADLLTAPFAASQRVLQNLPLAFSGADLGVRICLPRVPHISIFGQSGSGKNVGIIAPTLLTYRGPVLVLDPKSESYRGVYSVRTKRMGRRVRRIDPYHLVSATGGESINPLGWIDPSSPFVPDIARDLACALVVRTGLEKEPFFPNMAELVLQTFITGTIWGAPLEDRNIITISELIANPITFGTTLTAMQASDAYGGVLRTLAHQVATLEGREKAAVLSCVAQHLSFLSSQPIRDTLRTTTCDPLELKTGNSDLFLTIPPEKLRSASGYTRFLLTGILRRIAQGPPDESTEILAVFDEVATLGPLPILEECVTLLRGWGLRGVYVWQAIGQLQDSLPGDKAKTFLANMGGLVFAKTNDLDTAKLVSEMVGETTVLTTSVNTGGSHSRPDGANPGGGRSPGQSSTSWGVTHAEAQRRLIRPEEFLLLPKNHMVVFTDRTKPLLVEQVRTYEARFREGVRPPRGSGRVTRAAAAVVGAIVIAAAVTAAAAPRVPPARTAPVPIHPRRPNGPPPRGTTVRPSQENRNGGKIGRKPRPGDVHAGAR